MKYSYALRALVNDEFRNSKRYSYQVTMAILFMPLSFVFLVAELLVIPLFAVISDRKASFNMLK